MPCEWRSWGTPPAAQEPYPGAPSGGGMQNVSILLTNGCLPVVSVAVHSQAMLPGPQCPTSMLCPHSSRADGCPQHLFPLPSSAAPDARGWLQFSFPLERWAGLFERLAARPRLFLSIYFHPGPEATSPCLAVRRRGTMRGGSVAVLGFPYPWQQR